MREFKHQLYLLEQNSDSFDIWSEIQQLHWIYTEAKSLIKKLEPDAPE